MHITGKILIWLIVLGAIVPLVLTSKAVTYRNSWTKQIEDLREKNEKKQQDIVPKARTLVE